MNKSPQPNEQDMQVSRINTKLTEYDIAIPDFIMQFSEEKDLLEKLEREITDYYQNFMSKEHSNRSSVEKLSEAEQLLRNIELKLSDFASEHNFDLQDSVMKANKEWERQQVEITKMHEELDKKKL